MIFQGPRSLFATEDGGLVFQGESPLVKIDACSG
jgi:hypothetical protein